MKNLIEYYKNKATESERFLMLYIPIMIVVLTIVFSLGPIISANFKSQPPSPFLHTSEPVVETADPPVVEFNSVESASTPNQNINITGTNTTIYINGKRIQ